MLPSHLSGSVLYVVSADDLHALAVSAAQEAIRSTRAAHPEILPDRPLNQTELARLLRCSTEHIRQLEKRGELHPEYDGRQKLYAPEDVAAFLRRRLEGAAA